MTDMINLNSEEFDSQQITIFNNGEAGIAKNVKVSVKKKGKDDGERWPDYHLVFTDANGGEVNRGFYYLSSDEDNFKDKLVRQGADLKHIWGNLLGEKEIPNFSNPKELLDGMMSLFKKAVDADPEKLYQVVVDYGSTMYPKKYLQVKFFPPYFESVAVEESRLQVSKNAQMTPFVEDKKDQSYDDVYTSTTSEDEDEDTSAWGN